MKLAIILGTGREGANSEKIASFVVEKQKILVLGLNI